MTIDAYTNPDFGWREKLIFLALALAGIIFCISIVLLIARMGRRSTNKAARAKEIYERTHERIQRFYELIIAGTSVVTFSTAYVIINHLCDLVNAGEAIPGPVLSLIFNAWENGRDFVLLLLICLSCLLNSFIDRILMPLKHLPKEEKAAVRMLGMFYAIILLLYLNSIGDKSEYHPLMMYYLGLMVGRFVYFDASFRDFLYSLKNIFFNLPLLLMGLSLTGFLCWMGFSFGYLLERNYYIVGIFYTHLFMLAGILLIYHTHIMDLIVRDPLKKRGRKKRYEEDPYYDDEQFDDYAEYEDYND